MRTASLTRKAGVKRGAPLNVDNLTTRRRITVSLRKMAVLDRVSLPCHYITFARAAKKLSGEDAQCKRKLDSCEVSLGFDKHIQSAMVTQLRRWRAQLGVDHPDYWRNRPL